MIFRPPSFIKCPTCERQFEKTGSASGSLHRAVYFTDGKVEAPRLPEFPLLSRCPSCLNYLWVEDAEEVGSDSQTDPQTFIWRPYPVRTLTIGEYHEAIGKSLSRNTEEEVYLRTQLWRQFNDRVREGKPLLKSALEEKVWKDNLTSLVDMLGSSDAEQGILKAEALRNLGLFQEALGELANVEDVHYKFMVDAIRKGCLEQLTEVGLIQPEPEPAKPSTLREIYRWLKRTGKLLRF